MNTKKKLFYYNKIFADILVGIIIPLLMYALTTLFFAIIMDAMRTVITKERAIQKMKEEAKRKKRPFSVYFKAFFPRLFQIWMRISANIKRRLNR